MTTASPDAPPAPRAPINRLALAGAIVLAVAIVVLAVTGGSGALTAPKAIVLGAVEGITEFLPISSTGHLLVTQRLLGLGTGEGKTAADTYVVAIQLGAILAVVMLYRRRLVQLGSGLIGRDAEGRHAADPTRRSRSRRQPSSGSRWTARSRTTSSDRGRW